ncbi:hypothetical protein THASP1DRAFT_21617 [Thamnocephalis sphaerospora]|uniref:Secreted protein n=1 Tax=Thamnocephalis sphaerospora TaxID=78915 RepID=A0A4P9XWN3_9FUNG|nr:hypothetical protein THASP1DRAFT_21617 [Thamnocephalis sphaerospora]|eukprot:RKP10706.1 hypothetical protein THASP1DRAFT_21617 [Thamnocephalis sphaerospora]
MLFLSRATLLTAGLVGLFAANTVLANPQASSFANPGSAAGSGCNIIMNDPKYNRLLGCARGNVPQNYTTSAEMEKALVVFCAPNHKCKESEIKLFLTGLLQSCGKDAATNPSNRAYQKFQDLYTAVPRWESYCRKDSNDEYCLMKAGDDGKFSPRAHSFTCDECGKSRVSTYASWESRTNGDYGKPVTQISQDLTNFNKKCPNIEVTEKDVAKKNEDTVAANSEKASSGALPASSPVALMVLMVTALLALQQ